jgi:hypothetical protein
MRDMSLYVLLTDGGDRVGQVWDIVPLCSVKRSCDATGQVGDVIPACPAKATSPGGFGVSSLPLLHCDLAPGTHRRVQRTQPTGIQANAEGPLHCIGVDAAISLAGPGRRAVGCPQGRSGNAIGVPDLRDLGRRRNCASGHKRRSLKNWVANIGGATLGLAPIR